MGRKIDGHRITIVLEYSACMILLLVFFPNMKWIYMHEAVSNAEPYLLTTCVRSGSGCIPRAQLVGGAHKSCAQTPPSSREEKANKLRTDGGRVQSEM